MAAKEDLLFLYLYLKYIFEICTSEICFNLNKCSFLIYNI